MLSTNGQSQALFILSSSLTPRSLSVGQTTPPESHPAWLSSSSSVLEQLFLPRPVPIASNIGNKRKRQQQQQQQQQQQRQQQHHHYQHQHYCHHQ